jgi:hypothetical protein
MISKTLKSIKTSPLLEIDILNLVNETAVTIA